MNQEIKCKSKQAKSKITIENIKKSENRNYLIIKIVEINQIQDYPETYNIWKFQNNHRKAKS